MLTYERKLQDQGSTVVIGVDEAGRGPLAGPVVAAAVVLNTFHFSCRIDDSKKLTPQQREIAFRQIIGHAKFRIGCIDEKIIDRVNILEATKLAMRRAVNDLVLYLGKDSAQKIHVLIDGNMDVGLTVPTTSIVRGDSLSLSIAAASIVAKVMRDRIMSVFDKKYPQYGFLKHKGYGTELHRAALLEFGPCLIHRKSFLKCLKNGKN